MAQESKELPIQGEISYQTPEALAFVEKLYKGSKPSLYFALIKSLIKLQKEGISTFQAGEEKSITFQTSSESVGQLLELVIGI